MGQWTEADLFRDCAVHHSDVAPNQALGEHTYSAVWSALRAWLVALFSRCRGGVFPNFARVTWHRVDGQLEDGAPMLRPVFVPSDMYLRAHLLLTGTGVARASGLNAAELEPCEEYSAMKIAIKYSCSLNKDVVFCCTRHLLHTLGEALRSGRPVRLDLGVGLLTGRDRCLAFRFHSQYLAHWPAAAPAARQLQPQRPQARSEGGRLEGWRSGGSGSGRVPVSRAGLTSTGDRRGAGCVSNAGAFGDDDDDDGSGSGDVSWDMGTDLRHGAGGGSGGGGGAASRPGSPVHRGYYVVRQQQPGRREAGQQQQQECRSPRPGEAAERHRGPEGPARPPSAGRSRPAWGVRVPPPPSPGRRHSASASTAPAPHSPSPSKSVNGRRAPDAAASPTRAVYHVTAGKARPGDCRRQHNIQRKLSCNELQYSLPCSPRPGGGGGDAATDAAMPVARAVQLAARTPRQRPASPAPPHRQPQQQPCLHTRQALSPRPQSHTPQVTNHPSEGAPWPLSAPRCRSQSAQAAVFAAAATEEVAQPNRRAQPASPRTDGASSCGTLAVRPPWGAGNGIRNRASSGGGGRPSSAPRLRSEESAAAAGAPTAAVIEGYLHQGRRVAWAYDAAAGGGCGGGAGAVDARQLWSPDSHISTAAGAARRGASTAIGAGSARRLFTGGATAAAAATVPITACIGNDCSVAQAWRTAPKPPSLQQQHQGGRWRVEDLSSAEVELDDHHVTSDQRRLNQHQHQHHQPKLGQENPQSGCSIRSNPMFHTPQKEKSSVRQATAAATAAPGQPGGRQPCAAGGSGGGPPARGMPAAGNGTGATRTPSRRRPGGEAPDHSPRLLRDQSSKHLRSPRSPSPRETTVAMAGTASRAAAPPDTAKASSGLTSRSQRRRAVVRTLSPRMDPAQCSYNLRYGVDGERTSLLSYDGGELGAEGLRAGARCEADGNDAAGEVHEADAQVAARWVRRRDVDGAGQALVSLSPGRPRDGPRPRGAARPNLLLPGCGGPLTPPAAAAVAAVATAAAAGWGGDGSVAGTGRTAPFRRTPLSPLPGGAAALQERDREDSFSSSSSGLVLTGRSRGEDDRSCGGSVNRVSSAGSRSEGGGDSVGSRGGDAGDLSSSCCGLHSADSLGYPLPLYDSSVGGCSSVCGAATTAMGSGGGAAAAANDSKGTITATVRAALGRHRHGRSATGGGGTRAAQAGACEGSDLHAPDIRQVDGDRNTNCASAMQLRPPAPQAQPRLLNVNLAPGRDRYGDAFAVPMIIQDDDLRAIAWEGVHPHPQGDRRSSGGGSGGARHHTGRLVHAPPLLVAAAGKCEAEDEAQGVLSLDCSNASSAEICWSARSARQACFDSEERCGAAAAAAPALPHRVACGCAGSPLEADAARLLS